MLTRLKVVGFKDLDEVDVRLGPLTCLAGPNGVGKSNFFDAVEFLSALAHMSLLEAARSVRGCDKHVDVRSLFRRVGDEQSDRMSFLAEMIVPETATDDVHQEAHATMTFLQYKLILRSGWQVGAPGHSSSVLEIESEERIHINKTSAPSRLGFKHRKAWRDMI